jgi:hypothetical protein
VGEVADEQFVDQVNRPEDPVDQEQDPIVVIVPADHQGVEAQDEIDDGVSAFHAFKITKKGPFWEK